MSHLLLQTWDSKLIFPPWFVEIQIFSIPFAYVVCFLTLHIFRQGFLLATLGPQCENFFPDPATANQLKTAFNIILPLGFIPMMLCTASGFAAYILDRPRLAFVVVTLLSMVYGLLLVVPQQVGRRHPLPKRV